MSTTVQPDQVVVYFVLVWYQYANIPSLTTVTRHIGLGVVWGRAYKMSIASTRRSVDMLSKVFAAFRQGSLVLCMPISK